MTDSYHTHWQSVLSVAEYDDACAAGYEVRCTKGSAAFGSVIPAFSGVGSLPILSLPSCSKKTRKSKSEKVKR